MADVCRKEYQAAERQQSGIPFQVREMSLGEVTSKVYEMPWP